MAERTWEYGRNRALIELDSQLRAARSSASQGSRSTRGAGDGDRVWKSINLSGIVGEEMGERNRNTLRLIDPPQGGCDSLQPSVARSNATASLDDNGALVIRSLPPRSLPPTRQKSTILALSEEAERLQRRLHETTGRERVLRENLEIQNQLHIKQLSDVEEEANAKVKNWQRAAEKMASIVNPKRLQKLAFVALWQRARQSRDLACAWRTWELRILQNTFLGWLIELKKRRKRDAGWLAAVLNEWAHLVKLKTEARGRENLCKLASAFVSFKLNVERRRCQNAMETRARSWRYRRAMASAWKGWRDSMQLRRRKENDLGLVHSWWRNCTLHRGFTGWKITVRRWHQERELQSKIQTRRLVTTYDQWRQFVKAKKLRERLLTIMEKQNKYRAARSSFQGWRIVTVAIRKERQDLEHRRNLRLLAISFDALAIAAMESRNTRDLDRRLISSTFDAWMVWTKLSLRHKRVAQDHFHHIQQRIVKKCLMSWQRHAAASTALSGKSAMAALAAKVEGMEETIKYYKENIKMLHEEKYQLHQSMAKMNTPPTTTQCAPSISSGYVWSKISCEPPFSPFPRMRHSSSRVHIDSSECHHGFSGAALYGGEWDGAWLNDVWIWLASVSDHVDDGWYRCESDLETGTIRARRDFAMCSVATNEFIVIGGFGGEFELGDVHVATLSWKEGHATRAGGPRVLWAEVNASGPRFSGRSHHSAEYHCKSRQVCVFGGYQTSAGFLNETWVLHLERQNWEQIRQEGLGTEPPPRRGHASVVVGDHMYIHGGFDGETHFSDLFVFDILLHKWTKVEPNGDIPCGRRSHAIEAFDDISIVMHGGFDGKQILDDVFILNVATHTWTKINIQGCPLPRALHSLVFCNHQLIACGGMGDEGPKKCMMVLENQAHRDVLDLEGRLKDAERISLMLAGRCNQLEEKNLEMEEQAMRMVVQQERLKVSLQKVKKNLNLTEIDV